MSDDSSDIDESLLPPTEECQKRVEAFVEITATNSALAQYFLQDYDWDVQSSVNAYMRQQRQSQSIIESFAGPGAKITSVPPSQFTIISWNIDGLDQNNLKNRTMDACKLIAYDKPDIVFLQEVVPETLKIIQEMLIEYTCFADKGTGYFNVTLLRVFTIYYDSHEIIPLRDTKMDRNMIAVMAHIGTMKIALLNVHLESTQAHMTKRVAQLKDCFAKMHSYPPEVTVIFGGDTNLRDKEVVMAGNIPPGVDDLWQKCGERRTAEYTWDLKHNTNKQMPSAKQPRMRFDRFYLKYADPVIVKPINFCIIGVEKVPNLTCFPSDHWGIRSECQILKN